MSNLSKQLELSKQTELYEGFIGGGYGSCLRAGLASLNMIPGTRLESAIGRIRESMTMELTEEQMDNALKFIQLFQRVLDIQEIKRSLPLEVIDIKVQANE